MLVGAHANLIAAAMYLTGMAANSLVRKAANDVFGIDFGWGTWALGAIVPAVLSFLVLPLLIRPADPRPGGGRGGGACAGPRGIAQPGEVAAR